jgi:hypothetical protein
MGSNFFRQSAHRDAPPARRIERMTGVLIWLRKAEDGYGARRRAPERSPFTVGEEAAGRVREFVAQRSARDTS